MTPEPIRCAGCRTPITGTALDVVVELELQAAPGLVLLVHPAAKWGGASACLFLARRRYTAVGA